MHEEGRYLQALELSVVSCTLWGFGVVEKVGSILLILGEIVKPWEIKQRSIKKLTSNGKQSWSPKDEYAHLTNQDNGLCLKLASRGRYLNVC